MSETCGTCRHFQVAFNTTDAGRCRAHPPTYGDSDATGQWPSVMAASSCGEWSRLYKDSPISKATVEEIAQRELTSRRLEEALLQVHEMCGKIEKRLARAQPDILESFKEAVAREGSFHRWLLNDASPEDIKAIASIPPETIRLSLDNYRRRKQEAMMAPAKGSPAKTAKVKKRIGRPPGSKNKKRK